MNTVRSLSGVVTAIIGVGLVCLLGLGVWLVVGEAGRASLVEDVQQQQEQTQKGIQGLEERVDELARRDRDQQEQIRLRSDLVDQRLDLLTTDGYLLVLRLVDDPDVSDALGRLSLVVGMEEDAFALALSQQGADPGADPAGALITARARVLAARVVLAEQVLAWMGGNPDFSEDHAQIAWLRVQLEETSGMVDALLQEGGTRPDGMGREWPTADERRGRYTFAHVWFEEVQRQTNRLIMDRLLRASLL